MRVLGRWSVASLLTILVNVASGLVALALVLTAVMLVLAPVVQGPVEVSAGWIGVGTKMTIPVSFSVDARTHRVTAPSLGVEDAQRDRGEHHFRLAVRGQQVEDRRRVRRGKVQGHGCLRRVTGTSRPA